MILGKFQIFVFFKFYKTYAVCYTSFKCLLYKLYYLEVKMYTSNNE
jgi:hypothetical protein